MANYDVFVKVGEIELQQLCNDFENQMVTPEELSDQSLMILEKIEKYDACLENEEEHARQRYMQRNSWRNIASF